jgi:hypothetical protein
VDTQIRAAESGEYFIDPPERVRRISPQYQNIVQINEDSRGCKASKDLEHQSFEHLRCPAKTKRQASEGKISFVSLKSGSVSCFWI